MRLRHRIGRTIFLAFGLVVALSPNMAFTQSAAPATDAAFVTLAPPATDPRVQQTKTVSITAPRPIRVAVFDLHVGKNVDVESAALTDQINVMIQALPAITVVNRNEIEKVAREHQMALSGLVETAAAVKLGGFLNAEYLLVGRASRIGQTYYLVLKIINVETTRQTVVSLKALAERGVDAILQQLAPKLTSAFGELQRSAQPDNADDPLARIRVLAAVLRGAVVVIDVSEEHISRPLRDPAASMALFHRLQDLGIEAIRPADPITGWKEALLQTGHYGDRKVDYLLEGEGTSAYAAQIQGMTSCRARVELRLVPVPGRRVLAADKGIGARVDLVESLAAKSALEEAAEEAFDALLARLNRIEIPEREATNEP